MQKLLTATTEELLGLFSLKLGAGTSKTKLQEQLNVENFGRFQFAVTNDFTIYLHHAWHHEEFQRQQGIRPEDLWYEGNIHVCAHGDAFRYIVVQFKSRSPFGGYYASEEEQRTNRHGHYACEMLILDYIEPLHTHPKAGIRRPLWDGDKLSIMDTVPSPHARKE